MKNKKDLSVSISPEINDLLESQAINKSKLINRLLSAYIKEHKLKQAGTELKNK